MKRYLIIDVNSGDWYDQANQLVTNVYKNSFGTNPRPLSWYTVIIDSNRVVGVLGVQLGNLEVLPIHEIYDMDHHLPSDYSISKAIYFSRFIATVPDVAPLLMYATSWYGCTNLYQFGTAIFTDKLYQRLTRLGIFYTSFTSVLPQIDQVVPHDRDYFSRSDIKPYWILLENKYQQLASFVSQIQERIIIYRDGIFTHLPL